MSFDTYSVYTDYGGNIYSDSCFHSVIRSFIPSTIHSSNECLLNPSFVPGHSAMSRNEQDKIVQSLHAGSSRSSRDKKSMVVIMQYRMRNVRGMLQKLREEQESHLGCVIAEKGSCREDTSKPKPKRWEGV